LSGALAGGGCNNSDTVTGPPRQEEHHDLTGEWVGTFDSIDFVDCDSGVAATATFTQTGTGVEGVLGAEARGCGAAGVSFEGTLEGDRLNGTLGTGSTTRYRSSPVVPLMEESWTPASS
jgi:hypothetical protein